MGRKKQTKNTKKIGAIIAGAALLLSMFQPILIANAQVPQTINYQSRLRTIGGVPITATTTIQFSLYNHISNGSSGDAPGSAGPLLWKETYDQASGACGAVQPDAQGYFFVQLGSCASFPAYIEFDSPLYLGVKIEADAEAAPRVLLASFPYALNSQRVNSLEATTTATGGQLLALENDLSFNIATGTFYGGGLSINGTSTLQNLTFTVATGTSLNLSNYLTIGAIRLDSTGTNNITSGAYLVGVFDEFTNSNATTVQAALFDLDTAITAVSSSLFAIDLQQVTDNGNTTTNAIQFAGATSTGSIIPGVHNTYSLGNMDLRWSDIWSGIVHVGTSTWDLAQVDNGAFTIGQNGGNERMRITTNGAVGIGINVPEQMLSIRDGLLVGQYEGIIPPGGKTANLILRATDGFAPGTQGSAYTTYQRSSVDIARIGIDTLDNINFDHWDGASWVTNMLINSIGDIGIGVLSPSYSLDIGADLRLAAQLMLGQYALLPVTGEQDGAMVYSTASSTPYFWDGIQWVAFATGTNPGALNLQQVTDNGNLTTNWIEFAGGTSTNDFLVYRPNDEVHLTVQSDNADSILILEGNAGATEIRMSSDGGSTLSSISSGISGSLIYTVNGFLPAYMDGINGYLGANTSNPLSQFHVYAPSASTTAIATYQNDVGDYQTFNVQGSPEGQITGSIGDIAMDVSLGNMYVKVTGNSTSTGWERVFTSDTGLVTLDMAYDGGGSGAGRFITSDAGPIQITNTTGTLGFLSVTHSTNAEGLWVNNLGNGSAFSARNMGSAAGFYSRNQGTGTGARFDNSTDDGTGLFIDNPVNGVGFRLDNAGSNFGSWIENTGSGYGMQIRSMSALGTALYVRQNAGHGILLDNNTGNRGLEINNNATGTGIYVYNASSDKGIHMYDIGGKTGFQIDKPLNGGNAIELNIDDGARAFYIAHNGTGEAFWMRNIGTGPSLWIEDAAVDSSPFVLNAAGQLGIGTSTPMYSLDIAGDARLSGQFMLGQYAANPLSGHQAGSLIYNTASSSPFYWDGSEWVALLGASASTSLGWLTSGNIGTNPVDNFIGTIDNQSLAFRTNNVQNMILTATGLLGVGSGVGIPGHMLEVAGDLGFALMDDSGDQLMEVSGNLIAGTAIYQMGDVTGVDTETMFTINPAQEGFYFTDGSVAIGTTTPNSLLHVQGGLNGRAVLVLDSDDGNANGQDAGIYINSDYINASDAAFIEFANNGTASGKLYSAPSESAFMSYGNNPLHLYTNGNARLTVTGSGNVGIGTSTPTHRLEVNGDGEWQVFRAYNNDDTEGIGIGVDAFGSDLSLNYDGGNHLLVSTYFGDTGDNYDYVFLGDRHLTVRQLSGFIGIATTTPDYRLDVLGDSRLSGQFMLGRFATLPISGYQAGALVYQNSSSTINYWDGIQWRTVATAEDVRSSLWDVDHDTGVQVEESADEDYIRFDTDGAERMYIRNDGYIGIGTDNPLVSLLMVGPGAHEASTLSVSGIAGMINIANFRDENGENVFRAGGSVAGNDLVVGFGDLDYGGNGTSMKVDYAENAILLSHSDLRFMDLAGGEYVGFMSPTAVATNTIWTLPGADGTNNQVLITDGAGTLSWATSSDLVDNIYTTDGDLAGDRTVSGDGVGLGINTVNGGYFEVDVEDATDYSFIHAYSDELELNVTNPSAYSGMVFNSGGVSFTHNASGSTTQLYIGSNMMLTDSLNFRGIEYAADYSANYTNRTLVDKEYVDNAITSSTVSAGNGLTLDSGVVKLGGTLTEMTYIDHQGNDLIIREFAGEPETLFAGDNFKIQDGDYEVRFGIGGTTNVGLTLENPSSTFSMFTFDDYVSVTSSRSDFLGLVYDKNYSSYFVDRSLVDKEYVDTHINEVTMQGAADNSIVADGYVYYDTGAAFWEDDGGAFKLEADAGGFQVAIGEAGGSQLYFKSDNGPGNPTEIKYRDGRALGDQHGIEYDADYSADYTDRSLVDKAYVDNYLSASAGSGLTWDAINNEIDLGGNLTGNVSLNYGGWDFKIEQGNSYQLYNTTNYVTYVSDGVDYTTLLQNKDNLQISGSAGFVGATYEFDYSANFTPRSLVDKEYVDDSIIANAPTIYTADGILTGNRILDGNFNSLTMSNLSGFYPTVVNGNEMTNITMDSDVLSLQSQDIGAGTSASLGLNLSSLDFSIYDGANNNGISLSPTQILIADGINNRGAEYSADYSANYTDRSLVDKEYVDNAIISSSSTLLFANGLVNASSTVELGGSMTKNTDIALATYRLQFNATDGYHRIADDRTEFVYGDSYFTAEDVGFEVEAADENEMVNYYMRNNLFEISGYTSSSTINPNFHGATYGDDYSAYFVDRSLVDKEYVDNAIVSATTTLQAAYDGGGTALGRSIVTNSAGEPVVITVPNNLWENSMGMTVNNGGVNGLGLGMMNYGGIDVSYLFMANDVTTTTNNNSGVVLYNHGTNEMELTVSATGTPISTLRLQDSSLIGQGAAVEARAPNYRIFGLRRTDVSENVDFLLDNANPNGVRAANRGSFAIDYNSGDAYINQDDNTSWSQILTADDQHWQRNSNILSPANSSDYQINITNNSASTLTGFKAVNTNDVSNYAGAVLELKGSGADFTNNIYFGKYGTNFYVPSWAGNGVLATDRNLVIGSVGTGTLIRFQVGGGYTAPTNRMTLDTDSLDLLAGVSLNVGGNTVLGDATSDTVTYNARVGSHVLPSTNNTYDLGSPSLSWRNIYASGTIYGNVVGYINPGYTEGSVIFQGASSLQQDNANFHWDDTNNRLLLGSNATSTAIGRKLDVNSSVSAGQSLVYLRNANGGGGGRTLHVVTEAGNFNEAVLIDNNGTGPGLSVLNGGAGNVYGLLVDSGRVGFGTTTPAFNLDLVGDARVSAQLMLGQYALNPATGNQAGAIIYNTASSTPFFWDGSEWIAVATGTGAAAGDLQAVTDLGNTTTNWISFAGGTSTADLDLEGSLFVADGERIFIGNRQALHMDMNNNYFAGTGNFATTGIGNVGVGIGSLAAVSTGFTNTAVGTASLQANTLGSYNQAFGYLALRNNIDGSENNAFGRAALDNNLSGNFNTAIGNTALLNNSSGGNNLAIGYAALDTNTTGNSNIGIGNGADVSSNNLTNAIAIGYLAEVAQSNSMSLGGVGANAVRVGIATTSPAYRLDVVGDARLSAQLMLGQYALNPVTGNQAGAMIYNTASSTPFFWDGSEWIAFATGTSGALNLQRVTDNGAITDNWIEFAGATSSGDIIPDTHDAYSLGNTDYRWSDIWGTTLHVGTSTWELTQNADQAFTITYPGKGEFARIDNTGRLGIGTQQPEELISTSGDLLIGQFDSLVPPLSAQNRQLLIRATDAALPGVQGTAYTTYQRNGADLIRVGLDTSDNINFGHNSGSWTTNVVIATTGNMGIGDTTPIRKLDILGSTTPGDNLFRVAGGDNGAYISMYASTTDDRNSVIEVQRNLEFFSQSNHIMSLENGGNVGIGMYNPSYSLDVVGDARLSAQFMLGQYALNPASGLQAGAMIYNAASSTPFFWDGSEWVAFATGTGAALNLQQVTDNGNLTTNWIQFAGGTSTGNFLINRTTAEAYLTVNSGNSDAYFDLIGNGGATALRMSSNGGTDYATFEIASNGSFNMVADGTSVIWGDAPTGNVGIGESSPTYRLHVDGGAAAGNNLFHAEAGLNNGHISMYVSSTDDRNSVIGFQRNLEFFSQNQMIMTITNSQRVGIGITNPLYELDVAGDARLSAELLLGQYATNPVSGSAPGSLIYNSSEDLLYFWDNSEWRALLADGDVSLDEAYDAGGAGLGRQIIADSGAVRLSGAGNGTAFQIDYSGSGQGFVFNHTGTGEGVLIAQNGTGLGMYIRQNSGTGIRLDNNTANDGLIVITDSTGTGIQVTNEGNSSHGLRIDNDTDGSAIYIDDTLGKSSINISKPSGSGDLLHMSNSGTGDAFDITNASSGSAFKLRNTGTGNSLFVEDEASDTTPFVLTADGDVGIGTDAPEARLHIEANNSLSNASLVRFQASNNTDIQSEIYFSAGGNSTNWNVNSSGNGGALVIRDGSSEVGKFLNNGFIINDGSLANIDFRVESDTNTHAMFVDATNGYVGFDQSVPLAKLHVGNTSAGSAADYDYLRMVGSGDVSHRVYLPTGSNLMVWDYNVTGNGGAIEFRDHAARVGMFTNSGLVINDGAASNIGLRVEGRDDANLFYTDASNNKVGIGTNSPAVKFHVIESGDIVAAFDRTTNDGTIISLRQGGTEEGTISVSANTVSYNAFTGSHYAWTNQAIEKGMLVTLTGENRYLHNNTDSEILYGVIKTTEINDVKVMGSYLSLQEPTKVSDENNPHLIMAVGNGEVWVADKGENINIGDYFISSDIAGHAEKDTGEFMVSHIVARAAESVDWTHVSTQINGVKHKKISVFFESFDKNNIQDSVAGTSLQGGEETLETVDLVVADAVFEGNITVKGHVAYGKDVVGQAMIMTGDDRVTVEFVDDYGTLPIVTLTPAGKVTVPYWVENASLQGFDIVLGEVQYADILFNWHAFGNNEGRVYVSNGTTMEIIVNDMGSSDLETELNALGQEVADPGMTTTTDEGTADVIVDTQSSADSADDSTVDTTTDTTADVTGETSTVTDQTNETEVVEEETAITESTPPDTETVVPETETTIE